MHTSDRVPTPIRNTRREFLRGLAGVAGVGSLAGVTGAGSLAALTGCGLFDETPPDQPLAQELTEFLAQTAALQDQYDAVLAAQPVLAPVLAEPRDAHRSHAAALASAIGVAVPAAPASRAPAPAGRAEAMAQLSASERAGRDAAVAVCLSSPPRLAALLGSIAAARASHLEILT